MRDLITRRLRSILINLYFPLEIKEQVRQKDIFETDALAYMEKMNAYTVMDTKIMDRIMKEYWNSNIDVSGNFFAASTCYNILTRYGLDFQHDYETSHRFYHKREVAKIRAHGCIMRVWMHSMQQRYFIEIAIYLVYLVSWQIVMLEFNTGYQTVRNLVPDTALVVNSGSASAAVKLAAQQNFVAEMDTAMEMYMWGMCLGVASIPFVIRKM